VTPRLVKVVAAVSVLAGAAVLVIEVGRFRAGTSIEIWLWGLVALGAIAFGAYELFAPSARRH
jgi:hypothetical protein